MSEWINTADYMPEENEKVLIQLPTTHDFTMARHTDGAFYDGYLRYCNIEWWQRIDPPSPIFHPGDEVIVGSGEKRLGVVVEDNHDGSYCVYIVLNQCCIYRVLHREMQATGVSYKEFVETMKVLSERQKTLW